MPSLDRNKVVVGTAYFPPTGKAYCHYHTTGNGGGFSTALDLVKAIADRYGNGFKEHVRYSRPVKTVNGSFPDRFQSFDQKQRVAFEDAVLAILEGKKPKLTLFQ